MTSKKLAKLVAAAGFGLTMLAGSVSAAVNFYPPVTTFEDDNLDFFINVDGSTDPTSGLGTLTVGDRLVSILKYNNSSGVFGGGPSAITPELTGVADITVTSVTPTGGGLANFGFGPTAGFQGNAGGATGVMVALFLDPLNDLTVAPPNCASLATCITAATNGALWATAGFTGDVNEGWYAKDAALTPTALLGVAASTKVGALNFFLNVITNNTGQTILSQACSGFAGPPVFCTAGGDNKVDVIGSGDLLGGQGLSGGLIADGVVARSDTDFQLATVPEPGSIALVGAALLGLGAVARRRRS